MPKRKKYDSDKLVKAFQNKQPLKKITEEFGFASSTQTKNAYLNALIESGVVPGINTSRGGKATLPREVAIKKRGSITIPKAMVESLGFKEGDSFTVRKSQAGLSLKLVKEDD